MNKFDEESILARSNSMKSKSLSKMRDQQESISQSEKKQSVIYQKLKTLQTENLSSYQQSPQSTKQNLKNFELFDLKQKIYIQKKKDIIGRIQNQQSQSGIQPLLKDQQIKTSEDNTQDKEKKLVEDLKNQLRDQEVKFQKFQELQKIQIDEKLENNINRNSQLSRQRFTSNADQKELNDSQIFKQNIKFKSLEAQKILVMIGQVLKKKIRASTFKIIMKRNLSQMVQDIVKNKSKKSDETFYRFMYDNIDQFQRDELTLKLQEQTKSSKAYQQIKSQISSLLENSSKIHQFMTSSAHKHSKKNVKEEEEESQFDEQQSLGSISSADQVDLQIIMSGEHKNFFDAYQFLQSVRIDAQVQNTAFPFFKQIKEFAMSKIQSSIFKKKKVEQSAKQKKEFELKKLIAEEKLKEVTTVKKVNFLGSLQQSLFAKKQVHVFNNDFKNQLQNKIFSKPRNGAHLWKIAKKLVIENNRKKKEKNFATLISTLVKQKNRSKQKQQKQNEKLKLRQSSGNQNQQNEDVPTETWLQTCNTKFFKIYTQYLIYPENKWIKYFNLAVSFTFLADYIMTGFIIANYRFFWGIEKQFIFCYQIYQVIISVQIIDIILNFFKIPQNKSETQSQQISLQYLKSFFIPDIIAVIPYSNFNPSLIPLRYFKIIKLPVYIEYCENFMIETCAQCLDPEKVQIVLRMNKLLLQLGIVSHFLACIWVHIGMKLQIELQTGWLHNNLQKKGQKDDFFSSYINGIYWVIYTFATIGYGNVVGVTQMEYLYNMLVIMIGICFFGYMIGTFQQLIKKMTNVDDFAKEQEQIDHWLMRLHQINNSRHLQSSIYQGVREFYNLKYKQDAMQIQNTQFFIQLKPRLQKQVLDVIFNQYYQKLSAVFIGCHDNFRRSIIKSCQFEYFQNYMNNEEQEEIEWPQTEEKPIIQSSGQISKKVYFIISGPVYMMDQNSMFEYSILESGAYFGDISVFLNEPNEFNFCYDPYGEKSIQFLSIDAEEFIGICRQYPIEYEILLERAYKRKQMNQNYKSIKLISIMKSIYSNSETIIKNFDKQCTLLQRVTLLSEFQKRLKLYELFISHYEMERINDHIQKFEEQKKKQIFSGENSENQPNEFDIENARMRVSRSDQKQLQKEFQLSESYISIDNQKESESPSKQNDQYKDMFVLKKIASIQNIKQRDTSNFAQFKEKSPKFNEIKNIQNQQMPHSAFGLNYNFKIQNAGEDNIIIQGEQINKQNQEVNQPAQNNDTTVFIDAQNNVNTIQQNELTQDVQIEVEVQNENKQQINKIIYSVNVNNVDLSEEDSSASVEHQFKDYETSNESKKEKKTLKKLKPYSFTRNTDELAPVIQNESNTSNTDNIVSNQQQQADLIAALNSEQQREPNSQSQHQENAIEQSSSQQI